MYGMMVGCKTELLLMIISSRTAAVFVCVSLSVDPSVWFTGGGSVTLDPGGGAGNTYFSRCQLSCLG